MENMDKGLTGPKWVLIVWPKISQTSQTFSAQKYLPKPKSSRFLKESFLWVSLIHVTD